METTGTHFYSTHFMEALLRNEEHYDFSQVTRWHMKAASLHHIESIFDLKLLFIPINKGGDHWIFIMVDMSLGKIGLWEPFGANPTEKNV